MKFIFLIATMFFVSFAFAGNWKAPGVSISQGWKNKDRCIKEQSQKDGFNGCFDVSKKDPRYHDVVSQEVDDLSKPIYKAKYNLAACDSPEDCQEKIIAAGSGYCQNGDQANYSKNSVMPGYSYFCYGIDGYEKKTVTTLQENATKKAAYEAELSQKAAEQAAYSKLAADANFGAKMIGLVGLRLRSKDLNRSHTKQVMRDYRELIDLLRVGSISHAKEEAESITPDGVRISQTDKDALLAEINSYLEQ